MNCDDVRELLPGYILDALNDHEMDEVSAHLVDCREHDDDLVDLCTTGMALALLDDDARPSPHLRDRVLSVTGPTPLRLPRPVAVDDVLDADLDDDDLVGEYDGFEGDGFEGVGFEGNDFDAEEREPLVAPSAPRRFGTWWIAGAAAAIALVMFGGGWYVGQRTAPAAQQAVRYSYEMRSPTGQLVRFAGIEGSDRVTVTMDGLTAQPEGRQYQVWAIRDGKWVSLGSCNTNAKGWWKGDFEFTLTRGEEVALTVEPAGGSPKPSSPAVLRTKL